MIVVGALYEHTSCDPRDPMARVQVLEAEAAGVTVCDRWDDLHKVAAEDLLSSYRQVSEALPPYPRFRANRSAA